MTKIIIDKVSWHTEVIGNPETEENIHMRFRTILNFLQDNNLTKRIILKENEKIDNETQFALEDLNEKGVIFIKKVYDKWLKSIDKGQSPNSISLLNKYLQKIID